MSALALRWPIAAARLPSASIGTCTDALASASPPLSPTCGKRLRATYSGSGLSGRPFGSPSVNSIGSTTLAERSMLSASMRSVFSFASASLSSAPICSSCGGGGSMPAASISACSSFSRVT